MVGSLGRKQLPCLLQIPQLSRTCSCLLFERFGGPGEATLHEVSQDGLVEVCLISYPVYCRPGPLEHVTHGNELNSSGAVSGCVSRR